MFVWIGVLIFRNPLSWGGIIEPWVNDLLLFDLETTMLATAIIDILVGGLLILNIIPWLAALVGSVHLIIVLVAAGINDITVRDIGLLAATLALTVEIWPFGRKISGELKSYGS